MKSIVWPEGGKTEYTYENNNFRVKNIPQGSRELINMLVDDNLALKKAEIQISGYPRSSFAPDPDYIDPVTKARCYKNVLPLVIIVMLILVMDGNVLLILA